MLNRFWKKISIGSKGASPVAEVFLSYSRKDSRWVERIREVFAPLLSDGSVSLWYDAMINPGDDWQAEITRSLQKSEIAILLLSKNYLHSKLVDRELRLIIERAKKGETVVFSLVTSSLDPSELEADLAVYNLINPPSEPLNDLEPVRQKAYFEKLYKSVSYSLLGRKHSVRSDEHSPTKDKYSVALSSAIKNIGGDTEGPNILGGNNIFFDAEEKLEKKHGH